MAESKPERRGIKRIPVRVPVAISSTQAGGPASGYTRDLSMSGIFLYTDAPIQEGSELEMVLILPPELTRGEKQWVCCRAAVVRIEPGPERDRTGFGVAASIRSLEILPEILG